MFLIQAIAKVHRYTCRWLDHDIRLQFCELSFGVIPTLNGENVLSLCLFNFYPFTITVNVVDSLLYQKKDPFTVMLNVKDSSQD